MAPSKYVPIVEVGFVVPIAFLSFASQSSIGDHSYTLLQFPSLSAEVELDVN